MRFPRASGVLLHPTSLPGPHGSGDFGPSAYHFVDWLAVGGQKRWQFLPLGGLGEGHSPYMSTSAFAGNVLLIDLAELHRRGWLDDADLQPAPGFSARMVRYDAVLPFRMVRLARAAQRFEAQASAEERADLAAFQAEHAAWLADYALFMALDEHFDGRPWSDWDAPLAAREPAALATAAERFAGRIRFWTFCQWCFFRQWGYLRAYAHGKGVQMVGDIPIFIAHHSADVWVRPELFELNACGRQTVVAGAPPDAFSLTGQHWGNPLYRWAVHAAEGYAWWTERIRHTLAQVDLVRIDHFRGFAACWSIPSADLHAMNGHWAPGPGAALFEAATQALGELPIIAEDLGVITPEVEALRRGFAYPGMRILQFAFGSDSSQPYLPHNFESDTVVYTGTHDNDTALGWWRSAEPHCRRHVQEYLGVDGHDIAWDLIRAACASVADTAIYPLQDVLCLGTEHRMNRPGVAGGNWSWRFDWPDVAPGAADRLRALCQLYRR
ncbi:MAG: 4-alpha-glucanotransferase [Leptothrix sp. (in: b-proteobacteria)]